MRPGARPGAVSDTRAMPTLPRPPCAQYGCKAPSVKGSRFCVDHAPASKPQAAKLQSDQAYKTAAWHGARMRQLSVAPLCQACTLAGRVTAAAHVDHVIPWRQLGQWAFHASPLQSLCGPCHSVKTGLEGRGVFRHYTDKGPVDYSLAALPADMPRP